ncbi:hypothetical protein KAR91_82605 [Candidatus Pacearchaeota archaeon]|nr:hypothetical protein [Candidatus Pacearchaeota archaeon]
MSKLSIHTLFGQCFDELRKIDREHSPIDSQSDKVSMSRQEIEVILDKLTSLVKAERQQEIINCIGSDSLNNDEVWRLVSQFYIQIVELKKSVHAQCEECLGGLTNDIPDFTRANPYKIVDLAEKDWNEAEDDDLERSTLDDEDEDDDDAYDDIAL